MKHQTALSVAYGTGLRASEVAALKVGDVDSTRMTLRIEQGKGAKDRLRLRYVAGDRHYGCALTDAKAFDGCAESNLQTEI